MRARRLRRRLTAGTVCRVEGSSIVVSTRSARGVPYIDRFGRRDGFRIGGGSHAELVNSDPTAAATRRRPEIARVDAAYRAWTRNRAGLDELHELQPAVAEALAGQLTAP